MNKVIIILGFIVGYLQNSALAFASNEPVIPAKRVIALAPHVVEMLAEVGALDTIIGTTDHSDFPEAAKNIPRVGNYSRLNIEQILASDPDLIIAWKTGNPSEDLARLEKFGIKVIYSDPHALRDVPKEIAYFAKFVGKAAKGKEVAESFLRRLEKIEASYQGKEKLKVFFELWSRPLTTTARKSWSQQQLEVCQITNPFVDSASDYPQVNVEQVVLEAPDVIIQPSSHGMNSPENIQWQQWPDIPAVKNNAFVYPNADAMHRMTSRSLNELDELCRQIDQFRH